ncbi:methyltransferase [Streptomyces sp. NPDC050523]|uniref:methyltransferase n=1 Tax=Streptomyces sp. NPDC050523 TaxID=3365622 RepID=UPI00378EFAE7
MQLATGFWAAKTLACAVQINLFDRLSGREIGRHEVAKELRIEDRPAIALLTACTALGLLDKKGDLYRNSVLSEEFLVRGKPYYFGGVVRYCDERLYESWHQLTKAVRTNQPVTWNPQVQDSLFAAEDSQMTALFWEAMHSMSSSTAHALLDVYDFSPHQRVLDVGGGSGAYLLELCGRHRHLSGTLYDLPHVCELADKRLHESGMDSAIKTVRGDFQTDAALPSGHDLILLSMILHDWDAQQNRALLRKCFEALPDGGVVMVSELLINPERTGPVGAALMGVNMLVETQGGRNYTENEYLGWLRDAGFTEADIIRFESSAANGVVIGRKNLQPENRRGQ